jgi:hypothetical protein
MRITSIAAALVLALTVTVVPAHAADEDAVVVTGRTLPTVQARETATRPTLLPVLYASYAGLQAYDIYSTRQALARGAREVNPLMQGAVQNNTTMIALKASVTAGTILAAERMWKKNNKVGAIAVLVASNSVAAIVAARNARTLGSLR